MKPRKNGQYYVQLRLIDPRVIDMYAGLPEKTKALEINRLLLLAMELDDLHQETRDGMEMLYDRVQDLESWIAMTRSLLVGQGSQLEQLAEDNQSLHEQIDQLVAALEVSETTE